MDVLVRGVPNLKAQRKNERKKSGKERETERLRHYRRNKNERDLVRGEAGEEVTRHVRRKSSIRKQEFILRAMKSHVEQRQ